MKKYLESKAYKDLKPAEKPAKSGSNLLEMTDEEKLAVMELLRLGKKPATIKAEYKRGTKSFTKAQILSVERDWKEALNEKKPKEDPLEEELKPKGK
jgi:hypothetical protein